MVPGGEGKNAERVSRGRPAALQSDRSGWTHRRVSTPVLGWPSVFHSEWSMAWGSLRELGKLDTMDLLRSNPERSHRLQASGPEPGLAAQE